MHITLGFRKAVLFWTTFAGSCELPVIFTVLTAAGQQLVQLAVWRFPRQHANNISDHFQQEWMEGNLPGGDERLERKRGRH